MLITFLAKLAEYTYSGLLYLDLYLLYVLLGPLPIRIQDLLNGFFFVLEIARSIDTTADTTAGKTQTLVLVRRTLSERTK